MPDNHVFDPKHIDVLESEDRKDRQNPEEIIQLLNLKPTDVVADLGCGSGYFAIPLSRKVKKVYGIDIQTEMLEYLEKKGVSTNIASFVGNASLRQYVMGYENRVPTDAEMDKMKMLLRY